VQNLATTFHRTKTDITWGITLTLMFRFVGAAIFGIAGDRYGRKWPFIVNNVLLIVFEMATGFTNTFKQFLAVRSLYGIAMGGLYGNATATALEDSPLKARGTLSGILQQGYTVGYLLATIFAGALVDTTSHEWRPLFWFGAGPPLLIILFRLVLPETDNWKERAEARKLGDGESVTKVFIEEGKIVLKRHPLLLIYLVFLMAGFNFMACRIPPKKEWVSLTRKQAHGSQDLSPTMLSNQYLFDANKVTVTQVVANLGACLGGVVMGYSSQIFGRRFVIIILCIVGGALLYPYSFVGSNAVMAAAFREQFMVQGAWGVIP
jgi:SHS family lactate transporter-like MFS transporter